MLTRARVSGMTTQHCIRAVFTSLAALEGVAWADVRMGVIEVEHDGRASVEALREAVAGAGYEVLDASTSRSPLRIRHPE